MHAVNDVDAARRDEGGATAVEYALVVGLVSIVVVAAVALFGGTITSFVDTISFR
ncbi:MAG: Flp family type IVb pilin [Aeromicrobium erythreum]